MERNTRLEKQGQDPILIHTDDEGSQIINEETGEVIRASAGDHHDEWVDEYVRGGWTIVDRKSSKAGHHN